jgi:hypothetical protein
LIAAEAGTWIDCTIENTTMKKILLGAVVCAAVSGVVFYLRDPEKFEEIVDDLKDKANDALAKVKETYAGAEENMSKAV